MYKYIIEKYRDNIEHFALKLSAMLQDLKIEGGCKSLEIDHNCLRPKDSEHVSRVRDELGSMGKEISCKPFQSRLH